MAGTFPIHLATGNIMLLQCACSPGTSVQSQSLGHANGAVCMLFAFVCGTTTSAAQKLGRGNNADKLFSLSVAWSGVDGNSGVLVEHPEVWEDGQHGTWCCQCAIKCGRRLCFASNLMCFTQNKEKYSSIQCTRNKAWFFKMSSVVHVNCLGCILSFTWFARRPRPWIS